MNPRLSLPNVLGPHGAEITAAMQAGLKFIDGLDTPQLLARVGQTIAEIFAAKARNAGKKVKVPKALEDAQREVDQLRTELAVKNAPNPATATQIAANETSISHGFNCFIISARFCRSTKGSDKSFCLLKPASGQHVPSALR